MPPYFVAAIACTVVHGALRRNPLKKEGLLQHKTSLTLRAALRQVPDGSPEGVLPSDFFTHDAEKMAELNPVPKQAPVGCHPKCTWTCGKTECDQVCSPVCAPPKCETKCGMLDIGTCDRSCEPPKCAVVCPTVQCEHEACPKCKTVCAPPNCTTNCAENCDSTCADPQCHWTCKPTPSCQQPKCALDCSNEKVCNINADVNARPTIPRMNGGKVLSRSLAYILPQPGPLGQGQGPLFMTGALAPNASAAAPGAAPQAGSSGGPCCGDPPPPQTGGEDNVALRNNDGKGGLPIKGVR